MVREEEPRPRQSSTSFFFYELVAGSSAAISPSLSARVARQIFRHNFCHLNVSYLLGVHIHPSPDLSPYAAYVTCASGVSEVITSTSVRDRIHSSLSNIFVVGSLPVFF